MNVLQYHARRISWLGSYSKLSNRERPDCSVNIWQLTTYAQSVLSHDSKTWFQMYNSINSEIIKLVPHAIIIREGSL